MTAANLVSYCAQIALLVLLCAALPRALGLRSAGAQYLFWRALLAVCLLLPLVEPWRRDVIAFVAAPAGQPLLSAAAAANPSPALSFLRLPLSAITALLVAGIGARIAWLGAGVLRLRRMRGSAIDAAEGFAGLQHAIGVTADVRWSRAVRHPATFGFLRPVVLLPVSLRASAETAQRAVVAHELHHVKRRDWAWVVGEELVRSVFWFHPAMWWLVSRVQLARETLVDELSIRTTNERRAYLDALLAFADDSGLASTPAFSARRHLFHRVMLLSKEGKMSSSRIALASCVLVAALGVGSWGVVRAFPLASVVVVPDVAPQSSAIRDAAIQQAVLRWNKAEKDTSLTREARLRLLQMGILEIDHAIGIDPANPDALTLKSAMLRSSAALTNRDEARALMTQQADELRAKAAAVEQQSAPPHQTRTTPGQLPPPPPPPPSRDLPRSPEQYVPPPPPPPDAPESFKKTFERLHPVHLRDGIRSPVLVHEVKAVYPEDVKAAKIGGDVELEAIIDSSGNVADARVITGIPELNDAALDALRQWTFKPGEVDHQPVAVVVQVEITFRVR